MDTSNGRGRASGQPAGASPVPARSRKRFELLEDCRSLILERITQTVAHALNRMSEELTAEALRSFRSDQQQALLDAVMLVRDNRTEIESRFRRSFSDVFERRLFAMNVAEEPGEPGEPDDPSVELTLVSDAVMNDRLSIDRLIGRTRSRLDPEEVLGIRARLGALLERDWFDERKHPVSPEAVFEALKAALAELSPRQEVKAALLDAFEPHVTQNLNGIYAVVNERLRASDVLPKIRPQVQPVGGGARRAAADPRGEAAPGAPPVPPHPGPAGAFIGAAMPPGPMPAAGPGGSRGRGYAGVAGPAHPGASAPEAAGAEPWPVGASDDGVADDPAQAFRQAMVAASEGRPGGRANVARLLADPLMFGLADLPVAPVQLPLVASLTALQRGPVPLGEASMLPEVVERVREQGSPLDQITVEIVSMVFDYIYADRRLPDSIKQQLLRLQVVAVKAALLDRSFFARRQHPMRRLIDRISDVGADPDADLAPASVLVLGLGAVVDRIIAEFDADLSVFDQALLAIESLARDEAERRAARVEETTRRAARDEALAMAHDAARAELGQRIDPDTPPFVREFLHRWWAGALARLRAEPPGDPAAPTWDDALRTADFLVWSVAPKQTEEITRLATVLPGLIRGLNQGLERVDIPTSERSAFFDELLRAHALEIAAAKKRAQSLAQAAAQPAVSVRLRDDGTVRVESRRSAVSADPPVASAADTLLSALRRGQRMELAGDDGPRILKLAWISPARKLFILSRYPDETVTIGGAELAFMLQRGQARIASDDSATDRAIGSVTGHEPAADEAARPIEQAPEAA